MSRFVVVLFVVSVASLVGCVSRPMSHADVHAALADHAWVVQMADDSDVVSLRVDGCRVDVPVYDAGDVSEPVTVLLHGTVGGRQIWAPMLAADGALLDARRVIAPDLLGHGTTTSENCYGRACHPRDFDDVARLLDAVLRERGVRSFELVAHSYGTLTALAFLEQFGDDYDVDRVAFVAPLGLPRWRAERTEADRESVSWLAHGLRVIGPSLDVFVHGAIDDCSVARSMGEMGFVPRTPEDGRALEELHLLWADRDDNGWTSFVLTRAELGRRPEAAREQIVAALDGRRVLLLGGRHDRVSTYDTQGSVYEALLDEAHHEPVDGGHFVPATRPEIVNAWLRGFFGLDASPDP